MTFARFLFGTAYLASIIALLGAAARLLRAGLMPGWAGAPARLSEIVLGLSLFQFLSQLTGTIGWFAPVPLMVGSAAVASLALLHSRSRNTFTPRGPPVRRTTAPAAAFGPHARKAATVALALSAIVVAQWTAWTLRALRIGVTDFDSLHYHLTFAARFVQDGSITSLNFVGPDPVQAYHPAGTELVYALTMLVYRNEFLVPIVSVAWLGLALLAGWCAGRHRGVAPLTLTAVALAFSLPGVAVLQAGSAHTDGSSAALFVTALAFLLMSKDRGGVFLAALAGGMAIGSKLTVLGPVLLLTALVVVRPSSSDRSLVRSARDSAIDAGTWFSGLALTGSYWFLRNALRTGSPLPTADLTLGPIRLPRPATPLMDTAAYSISHYLFDRRLMTEVIVPGWREAFGPAAGLVGGLCGVGVLVCLIRGPGWIRLLGSVALLSAAAYLVTPATALGFEGEPVFRFVVFNARYALPAIAIALVALGLAVSDGPAWSRSVTMGALGIAIVASQLERGLIAAWPARYAAPAFAAVVASVSILAGLAWWSQRSRSVTGITVGGLVVIGLVAGWFVHRSYAERRLTRDVSAEVLVAAAWSHSVTDAKIGAAGFLQLYALNGDMLANEVHYLVEPERHGGAGPLVTCPAFRRAINVGDYDYVVIGPTDPNQVVGAGRNDRDVVAHRWVADDPDATVVVDREEVTVIKIRGTLELVGCP